MPCFYWKHGHEGCGVRLCYWDRIELVSKMVKWSHLDKLAILSCILVMITIGVIPFGISIIPMMLAIKSVCFGKTWPRREKRTQQSTKRGSITKTDPPPALAELAEYFKKLPYVGDIKKPSLGVITDGDRQNSDIKWNAWSGHFSVVLNDGDKQVAIPFSAQVDPFTGNCGIKSFHHLGFVDSNLGTQQRKLWRERCLEALEGFLYHTCNAGIILGSDSLGGQSLQYIRAYGKDYMFSDKVWNPNYTWAKSHKVQVFSKVLVDRKYPEDSWLKLLSAKSTKNK